MWYFFTSVKPFCELINLSLNPILTCSKVPLLPVHFRFIMIVVTRWREYNCEALVADASSVTQSYIVVFAEDERTCEKNR